MTPSARRFYEAVATKCVPVVLSDRFVLPYVASSGGAGLLSAAAVRSFALHVPEGSSYRKAARWASRFAII